MLADFCGRLLSTVLLAEPSDSDGGRKGDLDRAAAFAEMITTRKVSAWDEKYYGKTLLNALELDSKREFPAHLPKDLVRPVSQFSGTSWTS